jgi:hypothetical protein
LLKRSSDVEPTSEGWQAARARTAGGATTATVDTASTGEASEDFALLVRDLFGNGAGAGVGRLAAQWHCPPCEQQRQGPFPPQQQQQPCAAEDAAALQQQCRACGRAAQCGHFVVGAASMRPESISVLREDWLPQAQSVAGRVSAGTSMAASHTRTFAAIRLQTRIRSGW